MRNLKIEKNVTNRSENLERYLREVSVQPMISIEEEVYHAKRIKGADKEASRDSLEKLVRANLRFAISAAKQYQNHGIQLDDLIMEANIGLITAAERFDETRGFKFISYAVWWIRQSILKAISEKSRRIRLPINRAKLSKDINNAAIRIEQWHERPATDEEIAEIVKLTPADIREIMDLTGKNLSINSTIPGNEELVYEDVLEDNSYAATKGLDRESCLMDITIALGSIPENNRNVLKYYYGIGGGEPLSLEDVGTKLGFGKERARQLRDRGIDLLRTKDVAKRLRVYM